MTVTERSSSIPAVPRRAVAQLGGDGPPPGAATQLQEVYNARPRVSALPPVSDRTAEKHATVHACCAIIAGDTAKVPLTVRQIDARGNPVRVREHGLNWLLNAEIAPGVPAQVGRFSLAYGYALRGTVAGYAPRDGRGDVELIDVLQEDRFSVTRTGRSRFYMFEDGAEVQRRVGSGVMVHARYCSSDGWDHRSPIRVAAESIGLALAGQKAAARHASGTQLRGYVKLEDNFADEEQRRISLQRVKAALADPDTGGVAILGMHDEVHRLDLSAADAQLLESRAFDRESIASIYRVPLFKLQAGQATRATGQQSAVDYLTDCLLHWTAGIESAANLGLLTAAERAAGLYLQHDYDVLQAATSRDRIEAAVRATGGPITTIDEGRAIFGLPPIDGGGMMYPPPNMTRRDTQDRDRREDGSDDDE